MTEVEKFGTLENGQAVFCYKITNKNGAYIRVLNYGCTIVSVCVPDRNGRLTDVALGYESLDEYVSLDGYLGMLVGRCANRIAEGRFILNGKQYQLAVNNGPNHLHGGIHGFSSRIFDCKCGENTLEFTLVSEDGDENYPGKLTLTALYRFTDDNEIVLNYRAESTADTVVNITNHSYFDLNGQGSSKAMEQRVKLYSGAFADINENMIPMGELRKIEKGSPFDFSEFKALGKDINADDEQLVLANGYDHSFSLDGECVDKYGVSGIKPAAELLSDGTGIKMEIFTTQPAVQMYTANFLTPREGKNGAVYAQRSAVAFETQNFPDAVNQSNFPSPVLRASEIYDHTTVYRFSNI